MIAFSLFSLAAASAALVPSKKCEALLATNPGAVHEVTIIRHGHKQYPPTAILGPEVAGLTYMQNEAGDHVKIRLEGSRDDTPSANAGALPPGDSRALPARASGRSRSPTDLSWIGDRALAARTRAALNQLEDARNFGFYLTNDEGPQRYFWFVPEGEAGLVPARVLDIHRHPDNRNQLKVTVLAEYVVENEPTLRDLPRAEGSRTRHVVEITSAELRTIVRNETHSSEEAATHFTDSLSPLEASTMQLARQLGLSKFSVSPADRTPGQREDWRVRPPLEDMNSITWGAIYVDIVREFGEPAALLSKEELGGERHGPDKFNIIDVFSRLHPRFVLAHYNSKRLEYIWVITEDGQLKIVPKMRIGNNLKTLPLRLSGGRQIFAGGDFTIAEDGSLRVGFSNEGYSAQGFAHARAGFANVGAFVSAVFRTQAGARVANFEFDHGANPFTRDYVENAHDEREPEGSKAPSWDPETEAPLEYSDWSKRQKGSATERRWAHYVLMTTPDSSLAEIKASYRGFSKRFHPDKHMQADQATRDRAERIFKIVGQAMSLLQ
jgi:hypothetical protein